MSYRDSKGNLATCFLIFVRFDSSTVGFGGFSAYAKINPFAAAVSSSGFKNVFGKTDSSTSFGANKVFGKLNTEMPPPLVVPSPRESPKVANPFSSPSPVHNPFMSIVESKDELWQTMAKDRLSADEARKSCFFNDRDFKSAPLSSSGRLNSFGGSAVGGGAFGSRSSAANNDDDGEEDEEGGDNEAELQRAESPTFTKYAMPENVPVVTGEEHEECLLQVRAKLFRLDAGGSSSSKDKSTNAGEAGPSSAAAGSAEWVEVGIGPVRLLKSRDGVAAGRLVMRREEKKGGIGASSLP